MTKNINPSVLFNLLIKKKKIIIRNVDHITFYKKVNTYLEL
jgi:hypothetical protein